MRRRFFRTQQLPPTFLIESRLSITSNNHVSPQPSKPWGTPTRVVVVGIVVMAGLMLLLVASVSPPPIAPTPTPPRVTLSAPSVWLESKPVPLPKAKVKRTWPAHSVQQESDQEVLDEMMAARYFSRLPQP